MIKISITVAFLFFGCNADSRLIRKELHERDITVQWFYYSYITNDSPDIVSIKKDGKEVELCRIRTAITDVKICRKNIIIKYYWSHRSRIDSLTELQEAFGYKIIFDSAGTLEERQQIPVGRN